MSTLAVFLLAATIAAQQTRHVTGIVVDGSSQAPVHGAVISEPSGKRLAVTDKKGKFSVSGATLPLSLRVSAPNLAPRLVDVPAMGTNLDLGRVFLWRAGRIRLALSSAFAGERVRWTFGTIQPGGKSVDVKREGKLSPGQTDLVFENIEPAQYMITLIGERPLQQCAIPIGLESGADLTIPVTIAPAIVDLEVLSGEKPMANASILFENVGRLWQATVKCDEHGRATEELWQRGKFWLFVLSKGTTTHADLRDLTGDDARFHVQMRAPAHTIHGLVVDATTGASLADVNVAIKMKTGTHTNRTDSGGNFEFEAIPEGEHVIQAWKKGYRYDKTTIVTVKAEDGDIDHTVRLEPMTGARHVHVSDAAGMPVAGASVLFGAGVRPVVLEPTDTDGNVDVPPGSGVLFIIPQGGSFAFRAIQADDTDPITIGVPAPSGLMTIVSESTKHDPIPYVFFILRVNGTLIPPPVISRLATTQHLPFRTDADGRAQLSGLPPGLYDVWPARTRVDLDAIFSGNPGAPAATVPVGSVPQAVTLTFRPAG